MTFRATLLALAATSLLGFVAVAASCGKARSPQAPQPPANGATEQLNATGCTCDQITVTISKIPPATVKGTAGPPPVMEVHGWTWPPQGHADATNVAGPKIVGGDLVFGRASGSQPVGAWDSAGGVNADHVVKFKVDGPKDECCKKVTAGISQTILSAETVATYEGGAKLTYFRECADGTKPPISDSTDKSILPWYRSDSFGSGATCGTDISVTYRDRPTRTVPIEKGRKKLNQVVDSAKFRTFFIWECPLKSFKVLGYIDWEISHTITLSHVGGTSITSVSSFAAETGRSTMGGPAAPNNKPITTGDISNNCFKTKEEGF